MTQEQLKTEIQKWVIQEAAAYRQDCGLQEYRRYMVLDGIEEFAAGASEEIKEVVGKYIRELLG